MDQQKLAVKTARRYMNKTGAVVLIYYFIMNLAVSIVMGIVGALYMFESFKNNIPITVDDVLAQVVDVATSNGWGYILTIAIGTLVIVLWRRRGFQLREIFVREKKITFRELLLLGCVFLLPQLFLQFYAPALEWVLNKLGFSAMEALEMATITTDNFSMFLYISFLGPISEELLFRGVLLRQLRPWGKQTAIFVSAMLFGLFHGNLIQTPFAFLVGLVLGYVTVEYSIYWAIALHVFNNFVMSDLMGRLSEISTEAGSVAMTLILGPACVIAIVQLIVNRKRVGQYLRTNKMGKISWKGLLSSPLMWIFIGLMLLNCLLTITKV